MAKDLAIVLNNGSINSAVVTALAAQKFRVILLHAEVGEAPLVSARSAYEQQVAHFKPYREHTLSMPFLSVVEPSEELAASASDPRHPTPIAPQMVNLLPLIGSAMSFAVHYRATSVHLGLRLGNDAENLAQATEYGQIWNEMMQVPCNQPEFMLEMPLLELEPWQVIDVGFQANAPLEKTWSCTEAGSEPCWACRACRGREAAFQQAAKPDPMRVVRKV